MIFPHLDHEHAALGERDGHIAGIDEVGRGPLAGPVVAAAVILNRADIPQGIRDSKKLSLAKREALFELIMIQSFGVGIGIASAQEIDQHNIRQATFLAMNRAWEALAVVPSFILIDGRDVPLTCPYPAKAIVKGDQQSLSISAASIIAKVTRDRIMCAYAQDYPEWGFDQHVGYPTAAHRKILQEKGPTPIHRRSFAPVRESLGQTHAPR